MSSSKNIFLPSQGQLFDQQNGNMTSAMNPKSVSSTTTRLVAPRPFYRSQITPEPFDYTNNTRREADQLQYIQNFPQRRLSVNQINGKITFTRSYLIDLSIFQNSHVHVYSSGLFVNDKSK